MAIDTNVRRASLMALESQPPALLFEEVMAIGAALDLEFRIQVGTEIAVVGQGCNTPSQ
jgi:hypothetical protein